MEIRPLNPTDHDDVRRFIDLPFQLYRDDPRWVPPFVNEVRTQLDPQRHPFYQHSQAAFFLALDGTQTVGRISVLDNARYNEYHGKRTAFFYHVDMVNDRAVSRALFAAAADWARRRGLDLLWGPKGFAPTDGQGVLVEGFDQRPAMGIPYNFSYYPDLYVDAGFEKQLDFVSAYMDRQIGLPEHFIEVAEKVRQRRGLTVRNFRNKKEMRPLIPRFANVYNQSFVEVQGYTPMTEIEIQVASQRILTVADPTMIKLLFKGDEIVGFVLAYPDLSAAIQRSRGRMWPTGWLHLMREFKRTEWINFNGAGILPQYRGVGGNAMLYAEMYKTLIDRTQYNYGDFVQVQETNMRMIQELAAVGVRPYKKHRVYRMAL